MYERSKNRGITLIALVITIIVILIIAVISIAMLTGENSIIFNAVKSKRDKAIGDAKEEVLLALNNAYTEYHAKEVTKTLESTETLYSITNDALNKVKQNNTINDEVEIKYNENSDGKFTARYKSESETAFEGTLDEDGVFTWDKN